MTMARLIDQTYGPVSGCSLAINLKKQTVATRCAESRDIDLGSSKPVAARYARARQVAPRPDLFKTWDCGSKRGKAVKIANNRNAERSFHTTPVTRILLRESEARSRQRK